MYIQQHVAESYAELRPMRPAVTETFPVYEDLVSTLVTAKDYPDPTVAHVLATLSGYSYSTADTVSMIMARMGLEENHCLLVGQYVDAMFINSTAYLVQSKDGRVVLLAYRGTEPLNFLTWLTGFDVNPDLVELKLGPKSDRYDVHAGFYRNARATRWQVVSALRRALDKRSILADDSSGVALPRGGEMEYPMEALYVTGHSLGGAMATIISLMLHGDPYYERIAETLRATYTFGQPMIGGPRLAEAANADPMLAERVIRYVYRRDVVPHLPPWGTGDFRHFGQEFGYDGRWRRSTVASRQMIPLGGLLGAAGDFFVSQHRLLRKLPFRYSFNDHLPRRYISTLTPAGRPTEFGDYFLGRVD